MIKISVFYLINTLKLTNIVIVNTFLVATLVHLLKKLL